MISYLSPYIQRKIWGGERLSLLKGLKHSSDLEPIGETWEISIHPEGTSFVDGKKLDLSPNESKLPYLVKLIDTNEELSVQVHPDDSYALKHEGGTGKSECWYILEAKNGSGIYLGLKPGVTKEFFVSSIKSNQNINELLNFYPVKKGEFFFVPAGSIHAIGGGITLAEVQQNSGITYRVWDWNRLDKNGQSRELHIEKSLDVINFKEECNQESYFCHLKSLEDNRGRTTLIDFKSFNLSLINLKKGENCILNVNDQVRFPSVLSLGGMLKINGQKLNEYDAVLIRDESSLECEALTDCSFLFIE